MVTDPIGDFITRIKNAQMAHLEAVSVPYSDVKMRIADLLKREGFIKEVTRRGKKVKKFLDIDLLYGEGGEPEIHDVRRLSKPSRRMYVKAGDIHPVKFGHGILVLSTPSGLLTDREARKKNVGGEALFTIW